MTENQSVHIYILRLRSPPGEPPRYYVGSAVDYEDRVRAHFAGAGAAFTKKYPPVEPVEVRAADRYDEEAATRRLMAERGIEFVRGGAYTRVQLPPEDIFTLQHEIWAAAGRCTNCGRDNHFVATCLAPLKQVPSPTALQSPSPTALQSPSPSALAAPSTALAASATALLAASPSTASSPSSCLPAGPGPGCLTGSGMDRKHRSSSSSPRGHRFPTGPGLDARQRVRFCRSVWAARARGSGARVGRGRAATRLVAGQRRRSCRCACRSDARTR